MGTSASEVVIVFDTKQPNTQLDLSYMPSHLRNEENDMSKHGINQTNSIGLELGINLAVYLGLMRQDRSAPSSQKVYRPDVRERYPSRFLNASLCIFAGTSAPPIFSEPNDRLFAFPAASTPRVLMNFKLDGESSFRPKNILTGLIKIPMSSAVALFATISVEEQQTGSNDDCKATTFIWR